jgi:hypothetical protein
LEVYLKALFLFNSLAPQKNDPGPRWFTEANMDENIFRALQGQRWHLAYHLVGNTLRTKSARRRRRFSIGRWVAPAECRLKECL